MKLPNSHNNITDDATADAFVRLLMEHRHRIYAFIAKQLPRAEDAEDVFQKTSIVLWKKMEQFEPDGSFFLGHAASHSTK